MRDPLMTAEDFYEILGIADDASRDDIKKAFNLALRRVPGEELRRARQVLLDEKQKLLVDFLRYDNRFIAVLGGEFCGDNVFSEDKLRLLLADEKSRPLWLAYLQGREKDEKWHIEAVHSLAVAWFWEGMSALRGYRYEGKEKVSPYEYAADAFDRAGARLGYLLRSQIFWAKWKGNEGEQACPPGAELSRPLGMGESSFLDSFREYVLNLIFREVEECGEEEARKVYYSAAAAFKAGEKIYDPRSFNSMPDGRGMILRLFRGVMNAWDRDGNRDFFLNPRFYIEKIEILLAENHVELAETAVCRLKNLPLLDGEKRELKMITARIKSAWVEEMVREGKGLEALKLIAELAENGVSQADLQLDRLVIKMLPLLEGLEPAYWVDTILGFLQHTGGRGEASRMLADFAAAGIEKACIEKMKIFAQSGDFDALAAFWQQALSWLEQIRNKVPADRYVAEVYEKYREKADDIEVLGALFLFEKGEKRKALAFLQKRLAEARKGSKKEKKIIECLVSFYFAMANEELEQERDMEEAIALLREGVRLTGSQELKKALAAVLNAKALTILETKLSRVRDRPEEMKNVLQQVREILQEAVSLDPADSVLRKNYYYVETALQKVRYSEESSIGGCMLEIIKWALWIMAFVFLVEMAGC